MGDGKTSPFDGTGKTSGGASGGHDFVRNPTSNAGSGGHNFLLNPGATNPGSVRDLTKVQAPAQKTGQAPDINPDTVAKGGKVLKADPQGSRDSTVTAPRKPFKLSGEGASASDMPEVGGDVGSY